MSNQVQQISCIKCVTSISLLLTNQGLHAKILHAFISESLAMSMHHYDLIKGTLSSDEKLIYEVTHVQAELLLSILRGAKL